MWEIESLGTIKHINGKSTESLELEKATEQ